MATSLCSAAFSQGLVGSGGLQPVIVQRGSQPMLGGVVVTMDEGAKEKRVNYLVDDGLILIPGMNFRNTMESMPCSCGRTVLQFMTIKDSFCASS